MSHKVLGCSTVAAALVISASTTQAQNILVNGSFENASQFNAGNPISLTSGPGATTGVGLGWASNFGGAAPVQSDMSSSPDSPLNGSYALLAQNAAGNAWNPQGTYQIVNATAGVTYTLNAYVLADTALTENPAQWNTPVDIQIQYLNSSLANIVTDDLGWSPIGALHTWQNYTLTGLAPAGTAYASVYLMFMENGSQTATDSLYFDNISLTPAPEPTTLALAGLGGAAALSLIRRRKN